MRVPETRYAKSGSVHLAYQTFGDGPLDLVLVPGWASHIEYAWEEPSFARFLEGLGTLGRVAWFDKRGTGLSDKVADLPILEVRMDDVRAVMDAVGMARAALLGISEGGSMCALFAATYPERTNALVLIDAFACRVRSEGYPWAPTREERESWIRQLEAGWGGEEEVATLAPSRADDPAFRKWFATYGRLSVSPSAAVALARMNTEIDIRSILRSIHVPTLVLHRRGDRDVAVENGRYLARSIPGARWEELAGDDHLPWVGDADTLLASLEEFLTGHRSLRPVARVLTTILFTDLVRSTELASRLGDRAWSELLANHDRIVRQALRRFGGREVKTTGDGFLATFDGPARSLRCAVALRDELRPLGLSVRCAVHTGECELREGDLSGLGVHIAARVLAIAQAEQILATSTVRDLVWGSGVTFAERGEHTLKGVEGPWHLLEVTGVPAS